MKKVFIFIGLKIAEIVGVFVLLFATSEFVFFAGILVREENFYINLFAGGIVGFLVLFMFVAIPGIIGLGFYLLVKKNWEWAKRISGQKKR